MSGGLSKSRANCNFVKFQDLDNTAEIKPFQNELDKCRTFTHDEIFNLVTEIRKSLETLKLDVFEVLNKKNDIDYLRRKMIGMEKKITDTKEKIEQELTKVLEEEETLIRDLKYFEQRVEEWAKPLSTITLNSSKPTSLYRVNSSHLNNPTVIFQKFLSESGGRYGGWLEQDHILFVRERKKNKEREKFYASIRGFLPNLTDHDILKHENWYTKYEELRSAQKEAIQRWKENKAFNQECDLKKKTKEVKETKKPSGYQTNITERIKEWRKNQKIKKLEELERQAQEKKLFEVQERAKMKKIQQIKKLAVSQYKAEKVKKNESELPSQGHKILSAIDRAKKKILLKSFQQQDIKFIEKKKSIQLELKLKATNKIQCLKLTKPPIDFFLERNPQRIFKPTLIWKQHCIQNHDNKEQQNKIINLNTIQRLAIPEWRRELQFN